MWLLKKNNKRDIHVIFLDKGFKKDSGDAMINLALMGFHAAYPSNTYKSINDFHNQYYQYQMQFSDLLYFC